LLAKLRTEDPSYKDPTLQRRRHLLTRSKNEKKQNPDLWQYSFNEKAAALETIVRNAGPVGVAEALLTLGAYVNILKRDDERRGLLGSSKGHKDGQPVQSDFVQQATRNGQIDMIRLLSSRGASQAALDQSLLLALEKGDPLSVEILLQYGSDAKECLGHGLQSISDTSPEMLELLLRASRPLSQLTVSSLLDDCARRGTTQLLGILLAYGGDPNHYGARALCTAVEGRNLAVFLQLLTGSIRIETDNLRNPVQIALRIRSWRDRCRFIEPLLCAGDCC